jgi:hypothetical protein
MNKYVHVVCIMVYHVNNKWNWWANEHLFSASFNSIYKYNYEENIKEGQTTQWPKEKGTKGQTMIYKTLHMKLMIE